MGLLQIDRRRACFFPDKPDGIKPHDAHPVLKVLQNDFQDFKENIRVAVIQIDLIIAKRAPDVFFTILGDNIIEQRMAARADNIG